MEIRIEKTSMIANQWFWLVKNLTNDEDPERIDFIQIEVSDENVTMIGKRLNK